MAAVLTGTLAISAYDIGRKVPEVFVDKTATKAVKDQWSKGTLVETEWHGKWYKAKILDIQGKLFKIHYEGYDDSWDEWVDASRIRSRSQ